MRGRILIVVLVMLLSACGNLPAYESRYTPAPAPAAATVVGHPPFDVTTVNAALSGDQSYVISVLGDSTGNGANEWVHLVAQRIASSYNRQVTVKGWNVDTNAYDADAVYGTGVPVTIWNASGPGKSAQWSVDNFPAMVPGPVDLTIINHGHNNPNGAVAGIGELVDLAYGKGTGGVVVLTQNPRADNPGRAQLEADTYKQIDKAFNRFDQGTVVVDVFGAFPTGDGLLGTLNNDRTHPNDAGQRIWADTVASGLQLR